MNPPIGRNDVKIFPSAAVDLVVQVWRHWGKIRGDCGVGVKAGFVDPEFVDGTFDIGAAFDFGKWMEQLAWHGSVEYWNSPSDYGWSYSDFALRSGVHYLFLTDQWRPYAGGGLGIHFFSWENDNVHGRYNNDDTNIGLYLLGGVETDLSDKWKGSAELRLDFADPDQTHILLSGIYMLGK